MPVGALAILIFVLTLIGGWLPVRFQSSLDEKRLSLLTSLAGGFLLGSALLIVVPEGFHIAEELAADSISELTLSAALLCGFLVMLAFEGLGLGHSVHEEHHDHAEEHGHGHVHHPESIAAVRLGLSVHAIADGLAIGAAAAIGPGSGAALIAVAVLLHKLPAAVSLGVFASHERPTQRAAMLDVLAFALVTPVALLIADRVFADQGPAWVALALLFSAGTFLYVATVDTLPSMHSSDMSRRTAAEVILGAATFAAIFWALSTSGVIVELH